MYLVSNFREERQVVAAEALGFPPLVFDPVATGEGRVVTHTVLILIQPDRSLDPTDAQFVRQRDQRGVVFLRALLPG